MSGLPAMPPVHDTGAPSSAARGRGGGAADAAPDWRSAAVWWARRQLGDRVRGLVRIHDVRVLDARDAWVSLDAGGRHVVVGLRREAAADGDGWFRLLYLTMSDDDGTVAVHALP